MVKIFHGSGSLLYKNLKSLHMQLLLKMYLWSEDIYFNCIPELCEFFFRQVYDELCCGAVGGLPLQESCLTRAAYR